MKALNFMLTEQPEIVPDDVQDPHSLSCKKEQ